MYCYQCTKCIDPNKGYFTSMLANNRRDFHVDCRPMFYYEKGSDPQQSDLFKEKPPCTSDTVMDR